MNQPFLTPKKPTLRPLIWAGSTTLVILFVATVVLFYLHLQDRRQKAVLLVKVQETKSDLDRLHLSLAQGELKRAFAELDQAQKSIEDLLPHAKIEFEPKGIAEPIKLPAVVPPPPPSSQPKQAPPPEPPAATVVAQQATPAGQPKPPPVSEPASSTTAAQKQPQPPPLSPTPAAPAAPAAAATAKLQPEPVPATAQPAAVPASLTMAADEEPFPLLVADNGEYVLVCEKDVKTLHLFRFSENRFKLIKSFACIVGANGLDKKKEGDFATPLGNYYTLRYINGKSLPEKYGPGAFVLNYPNFLDRRERKDGTGIWLHGHTPGLSLGDPKLQNTSGCIVVANDVHKYLTDLIRPNGTPVVVVNRLQFAKAASHHQLVQQIDAFMKSWAKAWESGKSERFMSHYASDFMNADGMNYQAFKRQKEKVNVGKKFIRVSVENQAVLLPQEKGGQIAVVRFTQQYRSNNFQSDSRKLFYLRKGQSGWQIIGESRL